MPRSQTCGRSPRSESPTRRSPLSPPVGSASSWCASQLAKAAGPASSPTRCHASTKSTLTTRLRRIVRFEPEDFAATIAELDARYLAGEAAARVNDFRPVMDTVGSSIVTSSGPMLGRIAFVDHRRVPFGSAETTGERSRSCGHWRPTLAIGRRPCMRSTPTAWY